MLSPREMEVLQFLARGFRNREIAKALVISRLDDEGSRSRTLFEKMGVRTRTRGSSARLDLFEKRASELGS